MRFLIFACLALVTANLAPFSALSTLMLIPMALTVFWQGAKPEKGAITWMLLAWLVWLPISVIISQSPGWSLPKAAVLLCLPLGWFAGQGLQVRNQFDILLNRALPVLLVILLIWGLLQGPNTFTQKPQGPFNDPNTYAALLNLLMLPLLARYLATDLALELRWKRTAHLALLAGSAFILLLVSSRGAALALILVLPTLFWMARNQQHFLRKSLLLICVVLVSYFAAWTVNGGTSVAQRLVDTLQGGDPSRAMLMKSAWLMIQAHPWFGTGLGTFQMLYPQFRYLEETSTAGGWVHNDYLQLWLEAGLPMFLLMLGLAAWVAWKLRCTLRQEGKEALLQVGYLAGIAAILLHALVNFLLFFASVSLLVGFYLARVSRAEEHASIIQVGLQPDSKHFRSVRLASGGYALILGYLLIGQVAVEGLLGESRWIQRMAFKWQIYYPRYKVAYWISVLAPFHPTPRQIMGQELSNGFEFDGTQQDPMLLEALSRMEESWQRAPCYLPFANDALAVIYQATRKRNLLEPLREHAMTVVSRSLECNARHGLSFYYAGSLAGADPDSIMWWRSGLAASPYLGERLLLATAILSRTTPGKERDLTELADSMAQSIRGMEANPGVHADQAFWGEAQYKLYQLTGKRAFTVLSAYSGSSSDQY